MVVLKPGDMIWISKPYSYVLKDIFRGIRCDCCLQESSFLKQCGKCHFVNYCSKSCQVSAWETHKMECKFLRKSQTQPVDMVRMACLVILKLKKYGPNEPSETIYGRKVTFGSLMSHAEDIKQSERRSIAVRAMRICVQDLIGEENTPPLEEFFEIYGKININQYCIKEAFRGIGSGLFLGASVFDHSCDPNASLTSCGVDLWIRASKHIRILKNDINQVRVSYLYHMDLPSDRQQILMKNYYFQCQCDRCSNEKLVEEMTKVLVSNEIASPYISELKDILERVKDMSENAKLFSVDLNRLENLIKKNILADTHITKIKALEKLFGTYMNHSDPGKALLYGLPLVEAYRQYYGPYYPTFGYHLYEIASMYIEEGKFSQALTFRKQAKEVLKVTMGEEHPLFQKFFEGGI